MEFEPTKMLSPQERLEFLLSTALFSPVPRDSEGLDLICRSAEQREFPPGHILFNEGDLGDYFLLMVDGSLRLLKGGIPVLTLSDPGECIGEMALIRDDPRSATVETLEATKVLQISRDDFYRALAKDSAIARGMLSVLDLKLRDNLEEKMRVERREIARMESMRMAQEVQQSLLPTREVQTPQLTTAGYCQPADVVGGDYYDYFSLPDGGFGLFLSDVMGHGVHSAMLMAMTKSCLHTQTIFDASVHGVLTAVGHVVEDQVKTFIYLSCCYVVIRPDSARLEFANAGHPPMLLYRAASQSLVELDSSYPPPGLFPVDADTLYAGQTVPWKRNDILVVYSDGLTESANGDEELYGAERLEQCIRSAAGLSPAEIRDAILEDLQVFLGGEAAKDDVTLVVVKAGA